MPQVVQPGPRDLFFAVFAESGVGVGEGAFPSVAESGTVLGAAVDGDDEVFAGTLEQVSALRPVRTTAGLLAKFEETAP